VDTVAKRPAATPDATNGAPGVSFNTGMCEHFSLKIGTIPMYPATYRDSRMTVGARPLYIPGARPYLEMICFVSAKRPIPLFCCWIMTISAGQLKAAEQAPAPIAMAIARVWPSPDGPRVLSNDCSSNLFMPNWVAVMGSMAPALT